MEEEGGGDGQALLGGQVSHPWLLTRWQALSSTWEPRGMDVVFVSLQVLSSPLTSVLFGDEEMPGVAQDLGLYSPVGSHG